MKIEKIDRINNMTTTRADVVENSLRNITSNNGGSLSKFIDAQPMKCIWYHIDRDASVVGKGFQDTAGPYDGGIKYIAIHDYVAYGYSDERPVDLEKEENMRLRYKLDTITMIHLPNTLTPRVGDRLSLSLENHRFLYKVNNSVPVNFNNKPFIRTEITKCDIKGADYYLSDFKKDELISRELRFIEGNVGTTFSPFMSSIDLENIKKLEAYKTELMNQYNDFFYNEDENIYSSYDMNHHGYLTYTPLLVDLQMEFRTLWTFGINTILNHETLVNKRTKHTYNKNVVRRFLNRIEGAWEDMRDNGIPFSGYSYSNNLTNPMYKIQSHLNNGLYYYIYDYYHGSDILVDDYGKIMLEMSNKRYADIPESLYDLCQKYTDDNLEIEWLLEFLKDFDFEVCFCCMIRVFIVLTIIDKTINKYKTLDRNIGILA